MPAAFGFWRRLTQRCGGYHAPGRQAGNGASSVRIAYSAGASVEGLEGRTLLAVTAAEYNTIRTTYVSFGLPSDMAQVNIVEMTPERLSMERLKGALTEATQTKLPDLVVMRTTDTLNTITYSSAADMLAVDIPSTQGAIYIVGFGSKPLTLDANGTGRVLSLGSFNSTCMLGLGGMLLTHGSTTGNGGAIFQRYGTLRLMNVAISGNVASGQGGGLDQDLGSSTLANVVFSGNSSSAAGGAMYLSSGDSVLTNVTIAGNTATNGNGGGLYVYDAKVRLRNTIVARNTAVSGPNVYENASVPSGANNLIGDGTGQSGLVDGVNGNLVGTPVRPIAPVFVNIAGSDWTAWDLGLQGTSPAINAGDNAWVPAGLTTDLAGAPRIYGLKVDMGAYEYTRLSAAEYATIRSTYPDFALPSDMKQVNIIEMAPDQLSVANLKSAITAAGTTTLPDLVVLRTTDTQNTITYSTSLEMPTIDIPASKGAIRIVGFGSKPLTLDAAGYNGVLSMGSANSTTIVGLGGMALTRGNASDGGGVYQLYGNLTLINVTIGGSTAGLGGGLYQFFGTSTLTNVAIGGNHATNLGGGMWVYSGSSTLTNVTINGNTAWNWGGGIYLDAGSMTLRNTIVAHGAGSSGPDVSQGYGSTLTGASNLIGDGSGQTGLVNGVNGNMVGTSASPLDPRLAEGETFGIGLSPLPGSPAIDAGDDSLVPAGISTDVYGAARIQGTHVNIGAVESVLPGKTGVTYVVTSLADSVAADGVLTLREALQAANANQTAGDAPAGSYSQPDRIEFTPGLSGTILTNAHPYKVRGSLTLVGPGAGALSLDAAGTQIVLDIRGPYAVAISGLTLTGGYSLCGGGLYAVGMDLILDHVTISGNRVLQSGGGMYQAFGSSTLTDVTISGNTAPTSGGGIYQSYGSSTLTNVTISGNTASSSGGGIYQSYGNSTLTNVTITGNSATTNGGGVYQSNATSTLTNVTISGNTAQLGAGVYQNYCSSTLTSVTIGGNTASSSGGGVYQFYGTTTVTNATIIGNRASNGSGGGVYLCGTATLRNATVCGNSASYGGHGDGVYQQWGSLTLYNTIVAQNNALGWDMYQDGTSTLSGAHNLIGVGVHESGLVNGVNGNLVGAVDGRIDPKFLGMTGTDWTKWDLRLQAISPAVNAGDNALVPPGITTDLASAPRIVGATVDMGAYEKQPTSVTAASVNDGAAQRSMVRSAAFTFGEAVVAPNGAFSLLTRAGIAVPNITAQASNPSGDGITWQVTFSGTGLDHGSLPDGTYKLVANAANIHDLAGIPLAADYRVRLFRLFGDCNGDRVVNRADLLTARQYLNQPATTAPWLDYNGNGTIDVSDVRSLKGRLRKPLL